MDFYRINEDYNRYLQNYEKEIKGSLRFNYMIPVPEECIERLIIKDVEDEKYRCRSCRLSYACPYGSSI